MSDGLERTVSAKDIYRTGYNTNDNVGGARDYCQRLCRSIVSEYKEHGRCELVNEIIDGRISKFDIISAVAFREATTILEQGSEEAKEVDSNKFPHYLKKMFRKKVGRGIETWQEWERFESAIRHKIMLDKDNRDEMQIVEDLFTAGRKYSAVTPKDVRTEQPFSQTTNPQSVRAEIPSTRPGEVRETEEREGTKLFHQEGLSEVESIPKTNAEGETGEPEPAVGTMTVSDRVKVEFEAQRIIREARASAKEERIRIINIARLQGEDEAGRIRQNAKSEAIAEQERIINEARAEADRIREEAKRDALSLKERAEAEAKRIIRTGLSDERNVMLEQVEYDLRDVLGKNEDTLGKAERIHNEMCDKTNAVQVAWVRSLDNTIEELNKIKEDFYTRIRNWQVSLYPHELGPLADRYVELYRMVNVDKLITEEFFRLYLAGNNKDNDMVRTDSDHSETAKVLEGLNKLNSLLLSFLRKFEASMNGLGLYVYYPKEGEAFDEVWHVIEDDSEFDYGASHRIASCVMPGVARKVNDSAEDEVIIRAVVKV